MSVAGIRRPHILLVLIDKVQHFFQILPRSCAYFSTLRDLENAVSVTKFLCENESKFYRAKRKVRMADFRIRGFSTDRISLEGNLRAQTYATKVYLYKAELEGASASPAMPFRRRHELDTRQAVRNPVPLKSDEQDGARKIPTPRACSSSGRTKGMLNITPM